MDVQTAAKTIQLILAPVVMVSACGLLLNAMLGHYTSINARLRDLSRERLGLVLRPQARDDEAFARERVIEIDHQGPMLINRHRLVHHAIVLANVSVALLIVSMFVTGAAALAHSSIIGTVALGVFLSAAAALMGTVLYLVTEVRSSHASVAYEAMRVVDLPVPWPTLP